MSIKDEKSMFYNAKPHLFEKARKLRVNMTMSEQKLWNGLKGKCMRDMRFRAQHPIDIFITDFYCHKLKLVIEVDGGYHDQEDQKEFDIGRENELNNLGIQVVRFTNDEIENDISSVLNQLEEICKKRYTMLQSPL